MTTEDKLKTIMSDLFGIDQSEINDDSSPENVARWDSLNSVMLSTIIEEEFAIQLTHEEMMANSYGAILKVLKDRGL